MIPIVTFLAPSFWMNLPSNVVHKSKIGLLWRGTKRGLNLTYHLERKVRDPQSCFYQTPFALVRWVGSNYKSKTSNLLAKWKDPQVQEHYQMATTRCLALCVGPQPIIYSKVKRFSQGPYHMATGKVVLHLEIRPTNLSGQKGSTYSPPPLKKIKK